MTARGNELWVVGRLGAGETFDAGNAVFTGSGADIVLLRVSKVNGSVVSGRLLGGPGDDYARKLRVDGDGGLWVYGDFEGQNFGAGSNRISSDGGRQLFAARYDLSGQLSQLYTVTGTGNQIAAGFALSSTSITVGGNFDRRIELGDGGLANPASAPRPAMFIGAIPRE